MRRVLIPLVTLACCLGGCRTTTDSSKSGTASGTAGDTGVMETTAAGVTDPGTGTAAGAGSGTATARAAPECPPQPTICPTAVSPVVCSADVYAGTPLASDARPMVWAGNECQGRMALIRWACDKNLLPSQLEGLECVPDATAGHCPPPAPVCKAELDPLVCRAGKYGTQVLDGPQALSAGGNNRCRAMANLRQAACRRNLDPDRLAAIDCTADKSLGQCPPPPDICSDPQVKTVCSVTRWRTGVKGEALEVRGGSGCEAKQSLARLACEKGLLPGDMDEIVCRFEK